MGLGQQAAIILIYLKLIMIINLNVSDFIMIVNLKIMINLKFTDSIMEVKINHHYFMELSIIIQYNLLIFKIKQLARLFLR